MEDKTVLRIGEVRISRMLGWHCYSPDKRDENQTHVPESCLVCKESFQDGTPQVVVEAADGTRHKTHVDCFD
ncbi:MAG: hypothetical protein WC845_02915 [Candidatus Staskawiczbacteria bacterium]